MDNIKDNPFVKKIIDVEKKIYFSFLNKKLEQEADKRRTGWEDSRYIALRNIKGRYQGKRCFIIGMGPSLTESDLNAIKQEYTFGMNSLVKRFESDLWRPDFYGVQDIHVYSRIKDTLMAENAKGNDKTIFFVANTIVSKYGAPKNWIQYPLNAAYHKYEARKHHYFAKASDDSYIAVYDGYSVTYSLAQIAMYLGFTDIYLIGTDCSYEKNKRQHFIEYGYQDKNFMTVGESMIVAFSELKKLADEKGIRIYNATRGGMLEVFPRVDLDDLNLKT